MYDLRILVFYHTRSTRIKFLTFFTTRPKYTAYCQPLFIELTQKPWQQPQLRTPFLPLLHRLEVETFHSRSASYVAVSAPPTCLEHASHVTVLYLSIQQLLALLAIPTMMWQWERCYRCCTRDIVAFQKNSVVLAPLGQTPAMSTSCRNPTTLLHNLSESSSGHFSVKPTHSHSCVNFEAHRCVPQICNSHLWHRLLLLLWLLTLPLFVCHSLHIPPTCKYLSHLPTCSFNSWLKRRVLTRRGQDFLCHLSMVSPSKPGAAHVLLLVRPIKLCLNFVSFSCLAFFLCSSAPSWICFIIASSTLLFPSCAKCSSNAFATVLVTFHVLLCSIWPKISIFLVIRTSSPYLLFCLT